MSDWIIYAFIVLLSFRMYNFCEETIGRWVHPVYPSEMSKEFGQNHKFFLGILYVVTIAIIVCGSGLFSSNIPMLFINKDSVEVGIRIINLKSILMLIYVSINLLMSWKFWKKHQTCITPTYKLSVFIWKICVIAYSVVVLLNSVQMTIFNMNERLVLEILFMICTSCEMLCFLQVELLKPREHIQENKPKSREVDRCEDEERIGGREFKSMLENRELKNDSLKKIVKRALLIKKCCIIILVLILVVLIFLTCMALLFSGDTGINCILGLCCLLYVAIIFYVFKYIKLPKQTLIYGLDNEFNENRRIAVGRLKVYLTENYLMSYSGAMMQIIERKNIVRVFWNRLPAGRYGSTMWEIVIESRQRKYIFSTYGVRVTDDAVECLVKEVMGDNWKRED